MIASRSRSVSLIAAAAALAGLGPKVTSQDRFDLATARPKAPAEPVERKPFDGSTRQQRRAAARLEVNAKILSDQSTGRFKTRIDRAARRAFVRRVVNGSVR